MVSSSMAKESNLILLTKSPSEDVETLLHSILDSFCGRRPSVCYVGDYAKHWTFQEWCKVTECCLTVFKNAVRFQLSKDEVTKEIHGLPSDYQRLFLDCLSCRREEVRRKLLNDTCNMNSAYLSDFDWQLKFVLGSDKMADIKQPLASVILNIEGETSKQLHLEMNKKELSAFINHLENTNKAICQLQT